MIHREGLGLGAHTTRGDARARIMRRLAAAGIGDASLEATILLTDALGITRLQVLNDGTETLGREGAGRLLEMVERRLRHEPLARIAGTAEFWGLPFALSPDTLVPRADSEAVVQAALAVLSADRPARILDLGTGTGCLLLSILHERPLAWGLGIDRAPGAILTARSNADRLSLGHCATFAVVDWTDALAGPFDLVVSNPPYIASAIISGLEPEVARFDPRRALDGGPDGLAAYRIILADAQRLLAPDGLIVVEIGFDQADAVTRLGREAGFGEPLQTHDLGGHVRALTLNIQAAGRRQT